MTFLKNRLARKHLVYVIACSTFFAIITTCIQLYFDYRKDIALIDRDLAMIEKSYIPSIVSSCYNFDDEQLKLLLEGIHSLRDIVYVEVSEQQQDHRRILAAVGDSKGNKNIVRHYPLVYQRKKQTLDLGLLHIYVSLESTQIRLLHRITVIIISNALKTFIMSFCILWIVHMLTVRHLKAIANFTNQLHADALDRKLILPQKCSTTLKADELDEIVAAINHLVLRIKASFDDLNSARMFQEKLLQELENKNEELSLEVVERKKVEVALKEREETYRNLIEEINDVIYHMGPNGMIVYISPVIKKFTGHDPLELIGRRFIELVYEEDHKALNDKINTCSVEDGPPLEFRLLSKAGEPIWVRCSINIRSDSNDGIQSQGVLTLITKEKQLQAQLLHVRKMEAIGTLAGGIAHDFNNILFPLLGFAEMLKDDLPADSLLQDNIDEIIRAALRAKDLVKQIIAFSSKGDKSVRPVKLQPVIEEVLKLLRSLIPSTISIHTAIDPDCGVVIADPTQIHQVIMNLVTNAFHAMEKNGGNLEVALRQIRLETDLIHFPELLPGKYALLSIKDTGVGIEKDVIGKIFDPYFTTKEMGKGTGLGLSVVQGIVKSCNGDIRIYSQPGIGTTIEVYLPISAQKVERLPDGQNLPTQSGNEKILLIDDEKAIVRMEQRMFERLGYQVIAYTDSLEALAAFKADPAIFDLVFTDMTMPNMTGFTLAKEMKKVRPDIPIIICSGLSYQIEEDLRLALGRIEVVMKPVVMHEVAATLRKMLDPSNEI